MAERKLSTPLKLLLEYGPLAVFFVTFSKFKTETVTLFGTDYTGFILATMIFIPVLVLASAVQFALTRKLSVMQILTLVLVLVFGGLSVWLNDPRFFKMKPTLIYTIFGAITGFGWLTGRPLLEKVMGEALPMTHAGWIELSKRITFLFFGLAVANELIWRNLSEDLWVDFKTFGLVGIMMVFMISQNGLFQRHALPAEGTPADQKPDDCKGDNSAD